MSDDDPRNMEQLRNEYPSGWRIITTENIVLLVDALLDSQPGWEFTPGEIANRAGIEPEAVPVSLGVLWEMGVVENVQGSQPLRYRFCPESGVAEAIIRLDGAVNAHAGGDDDC